jgi:uncharacterized peroxidase-related enzyme
VKKYNGTPMSWIKTTPYSDATGKLKKLYDAAKNPGGTIDNVIKIHALRPHTLDGHLSLYKNVLHHSGNTIPKWFLETLGVWVSSLNECSYCVEHHLCGLKNLLGDDVKANAIKAAIEARDINAAPLDDKQKIAMEYAGQLTLAPGTMCRDIVKRLQAAGYSDGEVLEINQVAAYFNYANRTVLGLGCTIESIV